MSEKTTQELEQQKLKIEIELLNYNLQKEKKEGKATKKNIGEVIRKNIAIILAIFSVVGGFIGIILPINQYFEEKKKEMLPTLNTEIIKLVTDLNDSDVIRREEAAVMLTYYGLDAIPILLLKLELSAPPDTERLIDAIKSIYDDEPKAILTEIIDAFRSEVKKNKDKESDDFYYNNIYNYFQLLTNLELNKSEKCKLRDLFYKSEKSKLRNLFDEFENDLAGDSRDDFKELFLIDLNTICNQLKMDSVKINM